VASSCEHSNDSLGFIKGGKFLDLLSDYQLLKVILLHGVRELCVLRAYLLIRGGIQKFPNSVDNEIYAYNNNTRREAT